jgi:hypothetical protein
LIDLASTRFHPVENRPLAGVSELTYTERNQTEKREIIVLVTCGEELSRVVAF